VAQPPLLVLTADFQHAYREGHSTRTALTQITDDYLKEINNKIVGAVLLDFSAAYDIIGHNLLLRKHMYCGFSSSATLWIQSYLSNITQRVFFNGSFSNAKHGKSVVYAGQLSRPSTLFYFTNNLPLALKKVGVSMYADDSTIYASATTANEVA
jgi:hypothetical protein